MLEPLIGLAQHNVREGWRVWVWKKYSECGRHEVHSLPVSDQNFLSLDVKNTLSWILSSPSAATVGLSAFSPGTCSRIPSSSCSSTCLCGCGNVGFWEHITWECLRRLGPFPPKPSCPLKHHALMRSWRFDAGWLSAKTASVILRNPETKVLLCATSTMEWCTLQSLLLLFDYR